MATSAGGWGARAVSHRLDRFTAVCVRRGPPPRRVRNLRALVRWCAPPELEVEPQAGRACTAGPPPWRPGADGCRRRRDPATNFFSAGARGSFHGVG